MNNQISNSVTNVGVAAGNWGYGRPGYGRPGYGRPGYGYGRPGYDRWGYDRWGYEGWGYPGWNNHTTWANAWNTGYVNPRYGSWYNGCWSGDWGAGSWWTPFALGAATWGVASTVANWGLGSNWFGSSTGGYVNPYYVSAPAAVVEASPYNYAEPVIVSAVPDEAAAQASSADRLVEAAIRDMRAGTYATALQSLDRAVQASPGDSVIHELRAVALFALGRYTEAAVALNAVLATAPGMDWTTLSNLYTDVSRYTAQLRRLEDFCRSHGDDAAAHFMLAYHYLVAGHPEQAADMLEVVVAKQPDDVVARRLLESIRPPADEAAQASPPPPEPPGAAGRPGGEAAAGELPEIDLVGRWQATSGSETVRLEITAESTFTWRATRGAGPSVELSGGIETAADAIRLESDEAGTMVGSVRSRGPDAFEFSLPGAPADVPPLLFERQRP